MERDSAKHSPRQDEQAKHEAAPGDRGPGLESRSQEGRLLEDTIERPFGGLDEADQRSTIARFLNQTTFPAAKDQLILDARDNGAYDWVVEWLESLPSQSRFENVQAVWETLGGEAEHRF